MKLADQTVEIHSKGIESTNQFSIAQTSKMFKILSDSLYSDKVMAIIRELSTNANDAHIAAGNRNPFKVILPTQANPNFTVRDYGTGLSQEDMEELYTTYGASNKNTSNDFTGCLGLGSKSPFAYTKSFTTTSYHNGKSYTYIAAMDELGVPSLNLVSVSDTDEPNGLEISFAVGKYDYGEFARKSKRIFHYFANKPIIEGGDDENLQNHKYSYSNYIIDGESWRVGKVSSNSSQYPSEANSPDAGVMAIMGNVAYPVDAEKIIGQKENTSNSSIQAWNRAFKKADIDNWKNLVREILNNNLYLEIDCKIGELEMDVSREGLQYTKQVIKTLREKTQQIYLELKKDMSKKLQECTNLVDAYATYYALADIAGGYSAGATWADPEGKTHELSVGEDLIYKLKSNKNLVVVNFKTPSHRSKRLVCTTDRIHCETLSGKGVRYWEKRKTGKVAFFYCDTRSPESARKIVTRYCNLNDCYAYLLIDTLNPAEDSKDGFDKLIKDIGGSQNLLKVSDFKDLMKSNRTSGGGSTGTISKDEVFILSESKDADDSCETLSGKNLNDSHYLRELSDDLQNKFENSTKNIVYVPVVRYQTPNDYPAINKINNLMRNYKEVFSKVNVFAIKNSSVKKLKDQGIKLVDFNEFYKKKLSSEASKLLAKRSSYFDVVEYCFGQYHKKDTEYTNNTRRWSSGCDYSDRLIMSHIINVYGLKYGDYLDKELSDSIDKWMLMHFFVAVTQGTWKTYRFSLQDYYDHIENIMHNLNLDLGKAKDIKEAYQSMKDLHSKITKYYDSDTATELCVPEKNTDIISSLDNIDDLRKSLRDGVDKSPVMKYIIAIADLEVSPLDFDNRDMVKIFQGGYNSSVHEWLSDIGGDVGLEKLRNALT